jgi:hypothetical protein
MWSVRLGSASQQYDFIYSRLQRTSRDEIPRFRLDFKYVPRDVGDFVNRTLVESFLKEYLEADGYFFIRLLAANASDFIVQEVVEQLWMTYVMKYGEMDAKRGEDAFFEFRKNPRLLSSSSQSPLRALSVLRKPDGMTDSERQYIKQNSDVGVGLLNATNTFEPVSREQSEQV